MDASLASFVMQRVCLLVFSVGGRLLAHVLVVSRGASRGARVTSLPSRASEPFTQSQRQVFLAAGGCFMKPRVASMRKADLDAIEEPRCRAGLALQSCTADLEAPTEQQSRCA